MKLSILYRGPLASCNYGCTYCPFAKHAESTAEHHADSSALNRFIDWVASENGHQFSIFFTPWGEALIRKRYQVALIRLTNLPNIEKAAIQSNGSCRMDWTEQCDKARLGLWLTYHPTQVERSRFLARCHDLIERQVRFSVGVVGMREHFDEIEALRRELPAHVYFWINAYKREANYYRSAETDVLTAIDPLFPLNNVKHPAFGRPCRTGNSVFSVDGAGTMRRCHFIENPIGNIYEPNWTSALRERLCINDHCGCHIGYVHMPELKLYETFAGGVLERIPVSHATRPE